MPKSSKSKTVFVCGACGNENPKWEGKCPYCGEWNTLAEFSQGGRVRGKSAWLGPAVGDIQELSNITTEDSHRLTLLSGEVNRVLGGGIVPSSLTLIAGDPGIGKSTLLLRVAADVSEMIGETLFVSGEESSAQVKMRADRLGISGKNLYALPSTNLDEIIEFLEARQPTLAVVDSIQAIYDGGIPSEAGGVVQIRECTRRLMEWAKAHDTAIILSGHVTKGGDIAGPRILEHMVDVVLYLEGDPISSWRLLRSVKNRFGSTNEVGVFEMTNAGLVEVKDPSRALIAERSEQTIGSVVVPAIEGSRPLLLELQALTSPSFLPNPRRVSTGVDYNRLLLICAVLTRRVGVSLSNQDVVVNVTGGFKIAEPAVDLGIALAIVSSLTGVPMDSNLVAIGEIGLGGEVRRVSQIERRVVEAARLGFERCLIPWGAVADLNEQGTGIVPVKSLGDAIDKCFPEIQRRAVLKAQNS